MQTYEETKRGEGEGGYYEINISFTITLTSFHIFKMNLRVKFKDLFKYYNTFHKFRTFSSTTGS